MRNAAACTNARCQQREDQLQQQISELQATNAALQLRSEAYEDALQGKEQDIKLLEGFLALLEAESETPDSRIRSVRKSVEDSRKRRSTQSPAESARSGHFEQPSHTPFPSSGKRNTRKHRRYKTTGDLEALHATFRQLSEEFEQLAALFRNLFSPPDADADDDVDVDEDVDGKVCDSALLNQLFSQVNNQIHDILTTVTHALQHSPSSDGHDVACGEEIDSLLDGVRLGWMKAKHVAWISLMGAPRKDGTTLQMGKSLEFVEALLFSALLYNPPESAVTPESPLGVGLQHESNH